MAEQFTDDWARGVLDGGMGKAQEFVDNPDQMEGLLDNLQEKIKGLPDTVGTAFKNVPLMASMVKSYITREYTEVSPKVIISLVSAFVYLVKQKDLIADTIPVVGLADDLAVATIAMAINEKELKAYEEWRNQQTAQEAAPEPIETFAAPAEKAAPVIIEEPEPAAEAIVEEAEPIVEEASAEAAAEEEPAEAAAEFIDGAMAESEEEAAPESAGEADSEEAFEDFEL